MPSKFVAQLAAHGARDPEALAAWIGRKKHGAKFAKLAAAGRKKKHDGKSGSSAPDRPAAEKKPAASPGGTVSPERLEAGRRQARGMTDTQLKNLRAGLVGKRDEVSRAQRQVLAEETRRRREAEKVNRAAAQEKHARDSAKLRAKLARENEARQEHERQQAEAARAAQEARQAREERKRQEDAAEREYYAKIGRRIDEERAQKAAESLRNAARPTRPKSRHESEPSHSGGLSKDEEKTLKAAEAQTGQMTLAQLEGFAGAYKPSSLAGRTRADDLRHEAITRELERRGLAYDEKTGAAVRKPGAKLDTAGRALERVRGLTSGARGMRMLDAREREAVSGARLRRMSDEKLAQNLAITRALVDSDQIPDARLTREDKKLVYDVMSDLRREHDRRKRRT